MLQAYSGDLTSATNKLHVYVLSVCCAIGLYHVSLVYCTVISLCFNTFTATDELYLVS